MLQENIDINKNVAMKAGIKSSLVYGYLLLKSSKSRYFLDLDDIYNDIPIIGKRTISRCIDKLISAKFVIKFDLTSEEKFEAISGKKMKGMGIGNKTCEWCECNTTVLHNHHFPIPRKLRGVETVNICPNCHYEFHHLTSELIIKEVV